VRLARTADKPAVTVEPNVKVKVNAGHSNPYLRLYALFGKPFPLLKLKPTQGTIKLHNENRCEVQFFKAKHTRKMRESYRVAHT
jgi:hypothetical protein